MALATHLLITHSLITLSDFFNVIVESCSGAAASLAKAVRNRASNLKEAQLLRLLQCVQNA